MSETLSMRGLFDALHAYQGAAVYAELLAPWSDDNPELREWLLAFAQRSGSPIPDAEHEELFDLYALGRICDLLLLGLPGGDTQRDWLAPSMSVGEFQSFFESLGMVASWPQGYAPFHHEIAQLVPSDDVNQAPAVLELVWPCLMLGPMLFLRAGARVSAGSLVLVPGIADAGMMYWAYYRKNRATMDLSNGWGSNSQWATCFRRDYEFGSMQFFNVDGSEDLTAAHSAPDEESGLSRAEAIEILTHRHFVSTRLPDDDLFPYSLAFRTGVSPPQEPDERSLFARMRNVLCLG
jgi:hypothetical protein